MKKKKNKNEFFDKTEKHTMLIGDALKKLDVVEDGSCKLVFADPPYNMGKKFGNNKDEWATPDDYKNWCIKWIEKCMNKLADDGSLMVMGHPRHSSYLVPYLDKNLHYANHIIYYYTDGMPEKKNFERRFEVILYYRKSEKNFIFNVDNVRMPLVRYDKTSNPKGKNPNDVWQIHRVRWNSKERVSLNNGKIAHLAQKPIRLMRRIILATTNDNDLVLDPFAGTGTTLVAAKELNRRSIGIELNGDYASLARNRISKAEKLEKELDYEQR